MTLRHTILLLAIAGLVVILVSALLTEKTELLAVELVVPGSSNHKPVPVRLVPTTLAQGLLFEHRQSTIKLTSLVDTFGPGACVLDANNDGWMDLFLVGGSGTRRHYGKAAWWQVTGGDRLYLNLGFGQGFADETSARFSGHQSFTSFGCSSADLDGDQWPELLVYGQGNPRLYRNVQGNFEPVDLGLEQHPEWLNSGAVFLDANLDGALDIYLTGFVTYKQGDKVLERFSGFDVSDEAPFEPGLYDAVPNRLLLQREPLVFEDQADAMGVANREGRSLGAMATDLDDDGDPDLIVINDHGTPNIVFINEAGDGFVISRQHPAWQLAGSRDAIRVGKNFVFTRRAGEYPAIISDGGEHQWREPHWLVNNSWGIASGDLNSDGYDELVIANGQYLPDPDAPMVTTGQANTLMLGTASGWTKQQASDESGKWLSTRGIVLADFNNDGRLDLLTANNNARVMLYTNRTVGGNYLSIDLAVPDNYRMGTRVTVTTEERQLTKVANFNQGFLSQGDRRLLFGLGAAQRVEDVQIEWPHHPPTLLQQVPVNQILVIGPEGILNRDPVRMAGVRPDQAPAQLQENIFSDDENIRLQAIARVREAETDSSVDWLMENLAHPSGEVRCAAADTLGTFFEEEEAAIRRKYLAIKPLTRMLRTEPRSAACAANALAHAERTRPVPELLEILSETASPELAVALVRALGMIRDLRAVPKLSELVEAHADPAIVASAMIALSRLGEQKAAWTNLRNRPRKTQLQVFSAMLRSPDAVVVAREALQETIDSMSANLEATEIEAFVEVLGSSGNRAYLSQLEAFLSNPDESVRGAAHRAMARLNGVFPAAVLTAPLEQVLNLLQEGRVRILAPEHLITLYQKGVPDELLLPFMSGISKEGLIQVIGHIAQQQPASLSPWLTACAGNRASPLLHKLYLSLPVGNRLEKGAIGCFLYGASNERDPLTSRVMAKSAMRDMDATQQVIYRSELARFDDFYQKR